MSDRLALQGPAVLVAKLPAAELEVTLIVTGAAAGCESWTVIGPDGAPALRAWDALPARYTGDPFDYTAFGKLAVFQPFAGVLVPADARRRLLAKREFIAEHFDTAGLPLGHGFDLPSVLVIPGSRPARPGG